MKRKNDRYEAMRDGHWWSVVDLKTMKRVPCPLNYIGYYHNKKDARLVAKALNQKDLELKKKAGGFLGMTTTMTIFDEAYVFTAKKECVCDIIPCKCGSEGCDEA
jgi:hypothetical protein